MRHRKHNHLLGVKTAHRTSLIANLSCSLIEKGRIKTTLAKARALRPAIEKAITLAKKAHATDDASKKVHLRRQAIARLRSKEAVKKLFDELVDQFVGRNGGYTRIYKLAIPRLGDAAEMGIIEFVEELQKKKAKKKRSSKKKQVSTLDSDKKNSAETEEKSLSDDESESLQESSDENKDLEGSNKSTSDSDSESKTELESAVNDQNTDSEAAESDAKDDDDAKDEKPKPSAKSENKQE